MARYYRWTSLARRAPSQANLQASEFQMLVGGVRQVAVAVNGETSGSGENAFRLNDNSTATKYFYGNDLDFGVIHTMTFDYGSSIAATQYRWYTANDSTERDTVSWLVEASDNGSTWTVVDAQFGYPVTFSRTSLVGTFTFNNAVEPAEPYCRFIRFTCTKRRSSTSLIQMAEFAVTEASTRVAALHVGEIDGTGNEDAEDVISLNDDDDDSKWVGSTSSQTETRTVAFDYGFLDIIPDAYYWTTGNDAPERDPVSWTVHWSQDGLDWELLDTRTDYAVTTARGAVVGPFAIDTGLGGGESYDVTGSIALTAAATGAVAKTGNAAGGMTLGLAVSDDAVKTGATAGGIPITLASAAAAVKTADIIGSTAVQLAATGTAARTVDTAGTVTVSLIAAGATDKTTDTTGAITALLALDGNASATEERDTVGTIALTALLSAVAAKDADAAGALSLALELAADIEKAGDVAGALGLTLDAVGDVIGLEGGEVLGSIPLALAIVATAAKVADVAGAITIDLDATGAVTTSTERDTTGILAVNLAITGTTGKQASTLGALSLVLALTAALRNIDWTLTPHTVGYIRTVITGRAPDIIAGHHQPTLTGSRT